MLRSLKSQLVIIFSLLLFLGLGINLFIELYGVPFTDLKGRESRKSGEVFRGLVLIADLKKERLNRWLEERRDDSQITSASKLVKDNLRLLRPAVDDLLSRKETEPSMWSLVGEEESYKNLEDFFNQVIEAYGIYDEIFLMDVQTGMVIMSTNKESIGEVSHAVSWCGQVIESGSPYITDVMFNPQGTKQHLMIMNIIKESDSSSQRRGEEEISTLLVMDADIDDFLEPLMHTGEGLGETGEVLLVNMDVEILTNLKFPLADGSTAMPLEYSISAKPAVFAARGEEGIIEAVDYRGIDVLAAYRHIKVSRGVEWGMVVKRDRKEVFESLRSEIVYSFAVSFIVLTTLVIIIFLVARQIIRPLRKLINATEAVASDGTTVEVPVIGTSEIAQLSTSFNSMIRRLNERTKELQEAQDELVRKEKMAVLGQLAGGVGHELRNPLGAIKNTAYFLNMALEDPDPAVKESLEILNKEVETSEKIIGSLLDFARPKKPDRRKVMVNDLIEEAVSGVALPFNVKVVRQFDDGLSVLLADPIQLGQVFGNIILNGFQAMPEGGELRIKTEVEDSDWLRISFTDTGTGISEENLRKVFEPLFTTKAKGIGLGLAVTRSMVREHGGDIDVKSSEGEGSTFTIRLPVGTGEGDGHE